MSLWEYKVITSGKGGFATPVLLEKFLNDLGRDEWEIIHFHTPPENFLAFTGLARRSTQRDWTLEDAAAAAAKVEAEKLRAEFEAKFKAGASSGAPVEERAPSFLEEKAAPDDGFRKPVDTSRDDDPEADDEKGDEWDKLTAQEEDELPTFFEAIKPHMRRNQRGPGMSVGVDYLAKKWDQTEDDLKGALAECGFIMPADEDAKAEYVEYDGDLYWLNINRRGELWINTKEKPRPVFRAVKAARIEVEAPPAREDAKPANEQKSDERSSRSDERGPRHEASESKAVESGEGTAPSGNRNNRAESPAAPLPEGQALLDKIRPHMRRNRRGPGGSGSSSFLARALRTNEGDLKNAFVGLGLTMPAGANDKPVYAEFGNEVWWLNVDSRGGLWINGREKKEGETLASAAANDAADAAGAADAAAAPPMESTPGMAASDGVPSPEVAPSATSADDRPSERSASDATAPQASGAGGDSSAMPTRPANPVLAGVRLLLREATRSGAVASKVDALAAELGKSEDELLTTLVGAGFRVPEKPREKPVFVEHVDEIMWLNRNAKGELWLNAKASKYASEKDEEDEGDEATGTNGESEGAESDSDKKPSRRGLRSRPKKA